MSKIVWDQPPLTPSTNQTIWAGKEDRSTASGNPLYSFVQYYLKVQMDFGLCRFNMKTEYFVSIPLFCVQTLY